MGYQWGLGLHFIILTIILVATTKSCLGARNTNSTLACFEHERLALLEFKHSVIIGHDISPSYDMLSSWVGDDCCRWERVTCNGVTGNIESLHLRGDLFTSYREYLVIKKLSTSLRELRNLKYLDLSGNDFQKNRIPEFIGSLNQLTYLNLSNSYISGIIPYHIGNLSHLKILDLGSYYSNDLMSHDISWISGLSSLAYLDLSRVNLTGAKIFDVWFYMAPSLKVIKLSNCGVLIDDRSLLRNFSTKLSNIKQLDLSENIFTDKLPHFFQNMTSLQFLDLSYPVGAALNFSSSFLKLLSMSPSLLELHLSRCNLKETPLSHVLHNLTTLSNIQKLDLSSNKLTSSILESVRELKLLQVLDLHDNDLTGPIPESVSELKLLQVLDLHDNQLTGPIPESVSGLKLLQVLDLHDNQLTGPIPESMSKLKLLQVLDLFGNQLTGPIPESIGRLAALTTLSLRFNKLSGTIPVSIGQLSKLRSLDVYNNSLEGVVNESHFANLSMLENLYAAYNSKLTFNVSREWLPPFQLIEIVLSSCKIENGFPQWLQNQRKLERLGLSNATISGPLPTWLRKMPIMFFIDLSHNNLSGPLTNLPSEEFGIYSYDGYLFLQNNLFNESIPRSLCKWTSLAYLDLSRNRLTGKIPKCFKNLQYLEFMKLNSNGLSGTIPSFIGNMSSLGSLNLNDNNFSGKLPAEIWSISGLWVLDLGDNALCGKIPESVGEKMKTLQVFRLRNNNFTGEIPRSLCKSLKLQVLDVAHNSLTGTIPHCLGELQGMVEKPTSNGFLWSIYEGLIEVIQGMSLEYTNTWSFVTNMDLSSNKFVGDIPVELTALCELVGLNLSNNHLSGGIPDHIGNMTALISLDLSGNKLDGPIPPSIAALTFLSHLNLSNNNLSGRIPTGSQLQTLIDPSIYAGNKDLCGAPLPKNCSNHEDATIEADSKHEATDEPNKLWFYMDITCGFATGFWGVIVVLVLKKRWRHNLFVYVADTIDKIHVAVMVRVNKMKR